MTLLSMGNTLKLSSTNSLILALFSASRPLSTRARRHRSLPKNFAGCLRFKLSLAMVALSDPFLPFPQMYYTC